MNYILIFKERGNPSQVLLIDLFAAFNTLDHNILKIRLTTIGIWCIEIYWLVDFIFNRTFSIKLYDNYSKLKFLNSSGSHGSILSKLFIINMEPLSIVLYQFSKIKYVY